MIFKRFLSYDFCCPEVFLEIYDLSNFWIKDNLHMKLLRKSIELRVIWFLLIDYCFDFNNNSSEFFFWYSKFRIFFYAYDRQSYNYILRSYLDDSFALKTQMRLIKFVFLLFNNMCLLMFFVDCSRNSQNKMLRQSTDSTWKTSILLKADVSDGINILLLSLFVHHIIILNNFHYRPIMVI